MSTLIERITYRVLKPLHTRQCPCCGWHGFRFDGWGNEMLPRQDAMCPWCRSLERHRAARLLMHDRLGGGHRTLHIAAEYPLARWLRGVSVSYLSVDIQSHPGSVQMDLAALALPDACRSLVWCSHVLEHVADDRKAMGEIFRVLEPGGIAVVQVPVGGPKTYEDDSITTPAGRLAAFLQEDHVRLYGMDVVERLEAAGFTVETLRVDSMNPVSVRRHALMFRTTNEIFLCRKPNSVPKSVVATSAD